MICKVCGKVDVPGKWICPKCAEGKSALQLVGLCTKSVTKDMGLSMDKEIDAVFEVEQNDKM